MTDDKPLKDRLAVVTGASRGIGYECALALGRAGAHVIAIARTSGGLEELDDEIREAGGSATLVPLNLRDFDAIDRLGATIYERWGKLDILVGNAAMLGTVTPLSQVTPGNFDDVFSLNVTANYRLIRSLEPLLKASDAGRAIFVTSGAASSRRAYLATYAASKAALNAMVVAWSKEIRQTSMTANLLDPGTMRTKMRARYAPGENPETVTPPSEIADTVLEMASSSCTENGKTFGFVSKKWQD